MAIRWLDKKRARRGWAALAVAYVAVAIVLFADPGTSLDVEEAFGIPDYDWMVWSGDFPSVWARFEHSAIFDRISQDAPEARSRIDLIMRHASDIRWTPGRWRFWFGGPVVVTGIGDEVIVGVRAKLHTRAILALAHAAGYGDPESNSMLINGMYIARKGGALLVATSPMALSKFQSEIEIWSSIGDDGISFVQIRPDRLGVAIDVAEDELKISLSIEEIPLYDTRGEQYFSIDWPESPIVEVQARGSILDIELEAVSDAWASFPVHTEIDTAWSNFEALLPEGWRTGTNSVQFALFDVDTSETIPVPNAAVYARSETPLVPLMPPANAIPYEWSGAAGWMTPWQGEGAHLFVVANDHARVFANEEATMAAVMARERAGRVTSEDARIEINVAWLAEVLVDLAREAGQNEMWPEKNADDVERDVVPWLRAFGALGEIHLAGKYENGPLVLRGGTRAPKEIAEMPQVAE